ncbi:MAG: hypothetical protein ABI780_11320 [Ardenticatenales bacterium]
MPAMPSYRLAPAPARRALLFVLLTPWLVTGCTGDPAVPTPTGAAQAPTEGAAIVSSGQPTLTEPEALGTQRATGKVPTFVRSFGAPGIGDGQLQLPTGIAVDDAGNAYVADSVGVQVFDASGAFVRRVAQGDLVAVEGVAVTPDGGKLYVAERTPPVRVFDASGAAAGTVGQVGEAAGELKQPAAIALDDAGNLYVADAANGRIEVYDSSGRHARTIGKKGDQRGEFTQPRALAVGADGRLYVGVGDSYAIQIFSPEGTYVRSLAHSYKDETLFRIAGIALDDAGHIYASEAASHYLQVFDDKGWLSDLGKLGTSPTQFNTPSGLAYSGGQLYVVDQQNSRVQVFKTPDAAP